MDERAADVRGAQRDAGLPAASRTDRSDAPVDAPFERLTALAARVCDVPMAVITLGGDGHQWFTTRIELEPGATSDALAVCAEVAADAARRAETFAVRDLADPDVEAGAPGHGSVPDGWLCCHHGIALVDGRNASIGMLAVLDHDHRALDDVQRTALELLAEQVVTLVEQQRQRAELDDANLELERVNAELRAAARRHDELYRSNPSPMWISDAETLRFLDANEATVAVYGWTVDELRTMTVDEIRPPEDVAEFRRLLDAVADDDYYEMGPLRHRRADGSVFDVMVTGHRINVDGRPARLVTVRELGDAESAEAQLAEAAELLVDRLTAVLDVWRRLSDGDLSRDEVLDAMPRLAMEVLGAGGAVLFLADDDHLEPRSLAGYLTTAPRLPIEGSLAGWCFERASSTRTGDFTADPRAGIRTDRPDGSRSLVLAPVLGSAGPIGVLVVQHRDPDQFDAADERSLDLLAQALGALVRRAEAEAARRATEERLELVVAATTDAIYDWDIVAYRRWWNPGVEQLFGVPPAAHADDPAQWTERIHPADRRRVVDDTDAAIADPSRTAWHGAYRFRRSDGTYAHVRDRARIVRDADGRATRLLGGMSDVTDQVDAEARALQSQRLEAIGQLTGGVAHDFNNLLTVILGNADQLVADLEDRPDLQDFAEMTRAAAVRGAELSHRLLAFARRQALEPEPVDVNDLLAHLDSLLRRTLPEHVELELVRGAGLWSSFVDHGQLEGALLNLCLNARDAMPSGGRITIETANAHIGRDYADLHHDVRPGQYVMVAVSDTGTGIPGDIVDRVVEPFFTTKEQGVGSGLGLSMVHGFVKQSGGHFKIYTEPDEGTTIRLYLPRASREAPAAVHETPVHPDHRGRERILLVEDDPLVRRLATRHLTSLGYDVVSAGSGPEALEVLRREGRVDLLFTDVVMPGGMGGRQLADAAVEMQPDLKVLFTSGYTENAIVHHGRLDPGVHLLSKPYRPVDLARRVREVLDGDPA